MTILLITIWFLLGLCSCVYWWTKDSDFTVGDIGFALLVSVSGPFSFVVGWGMHSKESNKIFDKIIIRKKEGKKEDNIKWTKEK